MTNKRHHYFVYPLMIGLSLTVVESSFAQLNKFQSKTKFKSNMPSKKTAIPAQAAIPDPGADDLAGSSANGSDEVISPDSNFEDLATAQKSSGIDAFGRKDGSNQAKTDKKYVNLNPETAFGPEVVTSFDFPNVSILDLTKHMQKLTGLNLILDKDIKGKISISTPTPITIGDAWKAYLQALNINGYSLVKTGAYYTIVNNRNIRYSPTTMYTGSYIPNIDNYVMQIYTLKYISAKEIAISFRPYMSQYGRIIDLKGTNSILVLETGTHLNRLLKLIKFVDIPGHEETLHIIKVNNTAAQDIVTMLDKIIKGNANDNKFKTTMGGGNTQSSQINISRIIAENRTNSIIAMANAEGAKELRELIKKLDVKVVAAGTGQVHVYYLNYGDSEALSKTLSSLVSGGSKPSTGGGVLGTLSRFSGLGGGTQTTESLFNSEVKITSDKDNNALVVTASPTDYETVKAVISRLDIPRDQVYVEGLMMETLVNKQNGFGVSLLSAHGSGAASKIGYGKMGDLGNLMTNQITNLSGLFMGGGFGPTKNITMPDGKTLAVQGVQGLISAIAQSSNTNVLATPQLLTLDNVEGTFESGEQVPVQETTISNGVAQSSLKDKDVKLSLKITPQINKATRFIKLKIDQKIQDFSDRKDLPTGGIGVIIRNINTTVIVRDKDTIAMGGLMRDKETSSVNKVPLLGDIPVLGWLFKNTSKTIEKANLLFFMTPKILSSYQRANPENVKELLNRRQAHLKNEIGDNDAFDTSVKGLYDKAKRQEEGPLYDVAEAEKYKHQNEERHLKNNESSLNSTGGDEFEDTPNYGKIVEEKENNKVERK